VSAVDGDVLVVVGENGRVIGGDDAQDACGKAGVDDASRDAAIFQTRQHRDEARTAWSTPSCGTRALAPRPNQVKHSGVSLSREREVARRPNFQSRIDD